MKYLFLFLPLVLFSCKGNEKAINARQNLDSLLVLYPDSVELIVQRGTKFLKQYKFDKAMADAAKAFRIDSNNIQARLLFADILNNRPNRSISDVASAQRHFLVLLKKEPKNAKILVSLASTYSQQMDFEKSFKFINKALKIDPKYRDAYVMKGSNYLFLNKQELAKSSYETAVQQDPKFFEAYLMLGSLYQAENNPICMEYYKTAVQIKPRDPEVLFSLAYAQQVFDQPQEALRSYRKMIQLDTNYYQALNQIGVIKQHNYKEIDSAIYYYNSALQSEPRFVEAWHNLGTCYEEKGDLTKAMQSYAKALKYNPEFELSRERADILKNAR